jgi:hypothetical protein
MTLEKRSHTAISHLSFSISPSPMRLAAKLPILLSVLLALAFGYTGLHAQGSSPSPSPATAGPTPVPLAKIPSEAESTAEVVHEIEDSLSGDRTTLETTSDTLFKLDTEIDAKLAEDTRIMARRWPGCCSWWRLGADSSF